MNISTIDTGNATRAPLQNLYIVEGARKDNSRVRQPIKALSKEDAVRIASTWLGIQPSRVSLAASTNTFSIISLFDEIRFYRQLDVSRELFWRTVADVLRSGGTMQDALQDSVENALEPRFRGIIQSILMDVVGRMDVHEAMAQYPECFTAAEIQLVSLGKRDLPLASVIDRISADQLRNTRFATRVLSNAVAGQFTTVLALVMVVTAGKVVPAIYGPVYAAQSNGGVALQQGPLTQAAMLLADFILSPWTLIALVLFGVPLYYAIQRFRRRHDVRRAWESVEQGQGWVSRTFFPLGGIRQSLAVERMCALFAMLTATGKVTFHEAVITVSKSITHVHLAEALEEIAADLKSTTSDAITAMDVHVGPFDPMIAARFRTASRRKGNLAEIFAQRAEAIAFRVEFEDVVRVGPRVQAVSYIPAALATAWAGGSFFEPIINWIAHTKIHP